MSSGGAAGTATEIKKRVAKCTRKSQIFDLAFTALVSSHALGENKRKKMMRIISYGGAQYDGAASFSSTKANAETKTKTKTKTDAKTKAETETEIKAETKTKRPQRPVIHDDASSAAKGHAAAQIFFCLSPIEIG